VATAPRHPRPPIRPARLSNGLTLLCRANDASDIVSVVCLVRAGLPDEPDAKAGIAAVTAAAMIQGTTNRPPSAFQTALARAGGNLNAIPGFDFSEISIVTNRAQFPAALKLIADVVARPRLDAETVDAARKQVKLRAQRADQDFTTGSFQAMLSALYPRSPYGRARNGYASTLDTITEADVKRFWDENYVQNRITVAVVGNVDATRALDLAQKAFEDVPFRPNAVTPTPFTEVGNRPRVELIQRPGAVAQISVGYLAPPATKESYPVAAVLNAIVGGGKRGRLFSNIREKRGVGYELGSVYEPLQFQSHLFAYIVTPQFRRGPGGQPGESILDSVREQFLAQFRGLADTGCTDAELARAKAYVIGRQALRQERSRDQARWLAWNEMIGLGRDFDEVFPTRVQAVTKEQVQDAAKKIFGSYALVVTIPSAPG
jgi:zinc protease